MKEQIDRLAMRIAKHFPSTLISKCEETAIDLLQGNYIPSNEWLEYPKHKPSEKAHYQCVLSVELSEYGLEYQTHLWTDTQFMNCNDYIIAFKPQPIEKYNRPEPTKQQLLEFLENVRGKVAEKHKYKADILITKIENGDLK